MNYDAWRTNNYGWDNYEEEQEDPDYCPYCDSDLECGVCTNPDCDGDI